MADLFYTILKLSLQGSYVILILLVARLLLLRMPRRISCLLWLVAFFRLACPVSLSSVFSLMPRGEVLEPPQFLTETFLTDMTVGQTAQGYIGLSQTRFMPLQLLAWIWLIGLAAVGFHGLFSLWQLHRSLRGAVRTEDGVWEMEGLPTAFIVGMFRPRIYLPAGLSANEREVVLRHERAHLRRGDWLVKTTAYLLLCLHWFNPLVWLAFRLLCRDLEIACDEQVLRELGETQRGAYSRTLLHLAGGARNNGILAFGEGEVKGRIQHLLKYKKPAAVATGIVALLAVLLAAALLMNQRSETGPAWMEDLGLEQLDRAELLHHSAGETSAVWFEGTQLVELTRRLRSARVEAELTGTLREELLSAEWADYDSLYLLMRDGEVHTILRMGDGLLIDGAAYAPKGNWNAIWQTEGTETGLSEEMQLAVYGDLERANQILNALTTSILYQEEQGQLAFTVPTEVEGLEFALSISGETVSGEKWQGFAAETETQNWTAGKTYFAQVQELETLTVSLKVGEQKVTASLPMREESSGYIGFSTQNTPLE